MSKSLDYTIKHLQKTYDSVEPLYFSNFFKSNGDKWLYDQLQQHYRPVYENNFRLLVVQDQSDHYEYDDLPGLFTTTLQKYASQIDISNFFILIITPNKNIATELEQAKNLYSTDSCSMQFEIVEDLDFLSKSDSIVPKDTFCVLPWMHLYVGPDSNILPCCVADRQYPMGSINNQSIDSILKSDTFNQLRKNMLAGKRSKECHRCYVKEDAGLKSARQDHNRKWSQENLSINPDGTIDKFEPVYIDIRLNNICNLKCRMCNGYFSSAIAQEEAILFENRLPKDLTMIPIQRSMALTEIIEYLPYIEDIYFAGGEPLLAPEHYKILSSLIACGNTDLKINYNTNFTSLAYKDISVLDLWKKFSQVTVGASLDAMGDVAEYIRHGTKWSTIESNLESLKLQCPNVNFTVTSTVGFLNVSSLIELQKTWHENKILDISKFSMSAMVGPDHLTLTVLPREYKDQLDYKIKNHINWCRQNQATALAKQWADMLQYMWSKDSSHFLLEFKRLTNSMDQFRNESLSLVLPEFSSFI